MIFINTSISAFILKMTVMLIFTVSAFSFVSCASFETEQEGDVGKIYDVAGVKIFTDAGFDRVLAFALRNDSSQSVTVNIHPRGGEIGYRTQGATGYAGKSASQTVRAAYLVFNNDIVLQPGEEAMGWLFLKNWYLANKNFTNRFDFRVIDTEARHMIRIEADQNDIFDDAENMFQQNKLGRNDPTRYGAKHYGAGEPPKDFSLTVPE